MLSVHRESKKPQQPLQEKRGIKLGVCVRLSVHAKLESERFTTEGLH